MTGERNRKIKLHSKFSCFQICDFDWFDDLLPAVRKILVLRKFWNESRNDTVSHLRRYAFLVLPL